MLTYDSDGFSRWQAANAYATQTIIQLVKARGLGKRSNRGRAYADALRNNITDDALEPAFRAELLRLPSMSDIARELGKNVDHDHIFLAHRQLSRLLARTLGPELESLYDTLAPRGKFSADADAIGRRALRNIALTILTQRAQPSDLKRTANHFYDATNMTDQAHALALLCQSENKYRRAALNAFYDQWHTDHLVIDTWFAAQARLTNNGVIHEVRRLIKHKSFDITAPNKVRALIGTFASANPRQFNRADGAGYRFLADQILTIDKFNPQIAARLLGGLKAFRLLERGRRKHAHNQLRRIANTDGLSKDVYEIVSKTLEA